MTVDGLIARAYSELEKRDPNVTPKVAFESGWWAAIAWIAPEMDKP